jgi:hypothetical protein
MCRLLALLCLVGSVFFSVLTVSGAAGVTEIPLAVRSVVYDPFTDKLYASATNDLLQLDPLTGKLLNSFFLGTNVTLLSLGAQNGIWAAIEDERSIRRFDLGTFAPEDKILVSDFRRISDLYASSTDPTLALVALAPLPQISTAFVIRNGSVLPDSQNFVDALAVQGVSAYLTYQNRIYRLALSPTGFGDHLTSGPRGGRPYPFGPYVYTQDGTGTGCDLDGNCRRTGREWTYCDKSRRKHRLLSYVWPQQPDSFSFFASDLTKDQCNRTQWYRPQPGLFLIRGVSPTRRLQ